MDYKGTKHRWINGPDGGYYHCPICGISRCEDYGRLDTCEKVILYRANQINKRGKTFETDSLQWDKFLEQYYPKKYEKAQKKKDFIGWLLDKTKDKLNGL